MREGDGAAEVEAGSRERRVRPCSERKEPGVDSLFIKIKKRHPEEKTEAKT